MYQQQVRHPLTQSLDSLDGETFEAMFELFRQIGIFWRNLDDAEAYRSRLYAFMQNRINLRPIYHQYYQLARQTLDQLIAEQGQEQAYRLLFTDAQANQPPAETPLAVTRQKVSNEFVTFQLAQGGFRVFGADNYPGFIGGANIPGQPAPYRTAEE
ncbi:hypothetical protein [Zobellella aerophila]|uniref:Uncharacterized protein n=1 Tax=Zobellella aerophila TaxID=870480 RepID=A0ABP6VDC9_9GAMM